jgi:hypothetical protein
MPSTQGISSGETSAQDQKQPRGNHTRVSPAQEVHYSSMAGSPKNVAMCTLLPPPSAPVGKPFFPRNHSSLSNLSTLSSALSSTLLTVFNMWILNPYRATNTPVSTVKGTRITRAPLVSRHTRLLSAQLVSVRKLMSSHATSSRVQVN